MGKYAASPYGEVLLQKDMDGTLKKKGGAAYGEYRGIKNDLQKDLDETLKAKKSRLHVPEKCLTRLSSSSNYFSLGQSCCAATTQSAACLDGYELQWSDKKCALGGDSMGDFYSHGESSSSSANSFQSGTSLGSAGARQFECFSSEKDSNGPREEGMPGTQHRRRWRFNEDGAEGKTGSCCGYFSCTSCEENFAVRNTQMQCGPLEFWVCASQHR